jgi:diaminopimelate decarboxylase
MNQAPSLIDRYFTSRNGELWIGGIAVSNLAQSYGTPVFVYDRCVLEKKWNLLRRAFPHEFSVYYSVKANPNQTILRYFLAKGAGLEISSAGEYLQARHAGCSPDKILFAGPGKTEAELEMVLRDGVGEIHLESQLEAERTSALAERLNQRARVALRINPGSEAEGGAMRMGGRPAPFGVDEESVDEVLERILDLPFLDFGGIHLFTGTQILDYQILATQYRKGLEIGRRVANRLGKPLHTIDFGGGFGIPYFEHERELEVDKLQGAIEALMETVRGDRLLAGTQFLIEPGRYLVGDSGIYVTRVSDVKISRGKKFLIVDGGMNHHLAASGNLGQTIKRCYPVALLNKLDQPEYETVDVVGPLCTPLDVLARGVRLPHAEVGDLVGVFQSGAYARSASPLGFLSHASPPEVWVDGDNGRLVRTRGELAEYLRDQRL